jgi:tRNA uridine 5-carbamoylmethylation protein Kti12
MAQILINVDDTLKNRFINKVGYGNMTDWFATAMKYYVGDEKEFNPKKFDEATELTILKKRKESAEAKAREAETHFENAKRMKENIDKDLFKIVSDINAIENARRQREIEELQSQKEEIIKREKQEHLVRNLIDDSSKAHFTSYIEAVLDGKIKATPKEERTNG